MKNTRIDIKSGENLKAQISEIFRGFRLMRLKNKRVLVKPNMLKVANPADCVVTSPQLISATVSFLLEKGAQVIVGDNPAPPKRWNELEVAKKCGFLDAAHGQFRNIGRYSKKIRRPNNMLKEIYVSREVLDCDMLVSLPKFKSHQLTLMTGAIKNHFGIIPGGLKPYIHACFPRIEDFSKVLVEIFELRPADITIVDCLDIVDAAGKKFSPNKIIAGDNGHAVDYVCALMAGINPDRVPTIKIAREKNLFDPNQIKYHGEIEKMKGYALPYVFPFRNAFVEFGARFLYRVWLTGAPFIDSTLCSKCLSCENVCPKRAIKHLKIDYKKCIKCYCCLEVCPNQAIRTKFRF